MKWKNWLLFVVAVAGGALIWWAFQLSTLSVRDAPPTTAPVDVAPQPVSAPSNSQPTPAPPPAAASDSELPPPVDLDAADRDLDLFGVVVNEARAPIAGARVEVVTYPWRRTNMLAELELVLAASTGPSTKTAANGTFSIRLERGMTVNLRVTAAGYARTERSFCLAGERVEIVLGAPANLEVIVTDPAGAPAADVTLRVLLLDRSMSMQSMLDERSGVTDARGHFLFDDLQRGEGALRAEHVTWGSPELTKVTIDQPGTKTIQIQMQEGRTVSGHVRDAISGRSISGARVGVHWILDRPVFTDEHGNYEFPGWSENQLPDLHAVAEGYGRQQKAVPESGPVDFDLIPGDELHAQLVAGDGAPIADACITAFASGATDKENGSSASSQDIDLRSTISARDGSFNLTSLRADMKHFLLIHAHGFGRSLFYFDHAMAVGGVIRLGTIAMPDGQRIEGIVVSNNGVPIARATVTLNGNNADIHRFGQPTGRFAEKPSYGTTEQTATDDLGRFRFADLAPGEYTVSARERSFPAATQPVPLPPGQDIYGLRLELASGNQLVVRVVDSEGNAVVDTTVLAHFGERVAHEETDSAGEATFRALPSREVTVYTLESNHYMASRVEGVMPGGSTITLTLETASQISGVVQNSAGDPLVDVKLTATSRSDRTKRYVAWSTDTGSFELQVPEQTSFDIDADGKIGEAIWRGFVENIASSTSDVVILVEQKRFDRTLRVRVLNYDGTPLEGASLNVSGESYETPEDTPFKTDKGGSVVLDTLPAEELDVYCDLPDPPPSENAVRPEPLEVTPEGQEVTLRVRKGIVMHGRVVDERGRPIQGAVIKGNTYSRSEDEDTEPTDIGTISELSDSNGRFAFPMLPDSTIDLAAWTNLLEDEFLIGELPGVTDRSGEITIVLKKPEDK